MKIKAGKHQYEDLKVYIRVHEITDWSSKIEFGVVSPDGTELEIGTKILRVNDLLTLDGLMVMVTIDRS